MNFDEDITGRRLVSGEETAQEIQVGVDIRPRKRVLLYAQMKVPGKAWLEFDVQADQLVQTAHFLPRGLLGRLYWYSVLPFHHLVFKDLAYTVVAGKKSK